jgi:hypothetical protein
MLSPMPGTPVIHHSIGSPADSEPGTPNYEREFFPDDFVTPAPPPEELRPIRRLQHVSSVNSYHHLPAGGRKLIRDSLVCPEDLSIFEDSLENEELISGAPEVKEVRLAAVATPRRTPRLAAPSTPSQRGTGVLIDTPSFDRPTTPATPTK